MGKDLLNCHRLTLYMNSISGGLLSRLGLCVIGCLILPPVHTSLQLVPAPFCKLARLCMLATGSHLIFKGEKEFFSSSLTLPRFLASKEW
jgi:hypothetical protein